METTDVLQEPVQAELPESVLKARRLVTNFVNPDTEAVIVIKGNGRYAMLDLQASKAGKFRLLPDELLNERWREFLPRPPKMQKEPPAPLLPSHPEPVGFPVQVGEEAAAPLTVIETEEFQPPPVVAKKVISNDSQPSRKVSGKQS